MPGHGEQSASINPTVDYTVNGIKRRLIEKYKAVKSLVLLGNSLGGHLAVEVAPNLPNLQALILFGTPPLKKPLNIEEAFLPTDQFSPFFKSQYEEADLRKKLSSVVYNQVFLEQTLKDFIKTDPKFRDVWANSTAVDMELADEVAIIENLNIPIYVIAGKQDPAVNIDYIKSLSSIRNVYEIDECGHYPSLEQPEIFNAIVEEILAEIDI